MPLRHVTGTEADVDRKVHSKTNRYRILNNRVRSKIISRLVQVDPQPSCSGAHGCGYRNAIAVVAVVDGHQKGNWILARYIGEKR
jgi:hypothetical protein